MPSNCSVTPSHKGNSKRQQVFSAWAVSQEHHRTSADRHGDLGSLLQHGWLSEDSHYIYPRLLQCGDMHFHMCSIAALAAWVANKASLELLIRQVCHGAIHITSLTHSSTCGVLVLPQHLLITDLKLAAARENMLCNQTRIR